MREWDGEGVARAHLHFSTWNVLLKQANDDKVSMPPVGDQMSSLLGYARFPREFSQLHGFDVLLQAVDVVIGDLETKPSPENGLLELNSVRWVAQTQLHVNSLLQVLMHSLKGRVFLALSTEDQSLYVNSDPLFGQEVFEKFPDAARDISESGKCLALNRNTATVFHLMRAMEIALKVLATKLGATVQDRNQKFLTWGVIISNIGGKIEKMSNGTEKTDLWQVHALLNGINHAWRTPTMHPASAYSDSEASAIYDSVKAFMRHLSKVV